MSRSNVTLLIVLLLAVIFIATFISTLLLFPGGPELVLNGSFEDGNFVGTSQEPLDCSNGSCKQLCGSSTTVNSWRVFMQSTGGTQNCTNVPDAVAWVTQPNPWGITAQAGTRFMDLTGIRSRPPAKFGSIHQDVAGLEPGSTYELSFYVGTSNAFPPPTAPNGAFYRITVETSPGLPEGKVSFDLPPTANVSQWDLKKIPFTAVSPTITLSFSAFGSAPTNGNGGDYLGLDNVSLRKTCWIVRAILFGCP